MSADQFHLHMEALRTWAGKELAAKGAEPDDLISFGCGLGFMLQAHNDCWDSQLESSLAIAVRAVAAVREGLWPIRDSCPTGHDDHHCGSSELAICCQHPINNYRADIVLWGKHSIVVEVDGHDFHERTKEQAQRDKTRDRLFQQLGFKVLRYTGSEVWRDPIKCALEAVGFASGV